MKFLFIILSILDLTFTCAALQMSDLVEEKNPIAAFVIDYFGLWGLAVFKLVGVLLGLDV